MYKSETSNRPGSGGIIPVLVREGVVQPHPQLLRARREVCDWCTPQVHVYLTTVAGEEFKHIGWWRAYLVAMVITLIVNSDVINSCKVVSNVA